MFCHHCKNSSVQTNHLALPVGRAQDSYKFPTSEATIPEVATTVGKDLVEVQTVEKSRLLHWGKMIQEFYNGIVMLLNSE